MFIKIGKHWLNPANIMYIDETGAGFDVHFVAGGPYSLLKLIRGELNDSSYADMKAWLAKQEAPEPALK